MVCGNLPGGVYDEKICLSCGRECQAVTEIEGESLDPPIYYLLCNICRGLESAQQDLFGHRFD